MKTAKFALPILILLSLTAGIFAQTTEKPDALLLYRRGRDLEAVGRTQEADQLYNQSIEICKQELKLPDGPVNYNCEELLIKESSYNILLDYFKSLPQIKRVWLHGSRAQGTSNYGSDLDLLFDCELSAWEEVYSSFGKVLIPYFIDGKRKEVEYGNYKGYSLCRC